MQIHTRLEGCNIHPGRQYMCPKRLMSIKRDLEKRPTQLQKRPINIKSHAFDTCICINVYWVILDKCDIQPRRKHMSKETYVHVKRDLCTSKEIYVHQKRKIYIKKPGFCPPTLPPAPQLTRDHTVRHCN